MKDRSKGEGMNGWLAGWLGGWAGGWVDGWMDGWMDGAYAYSCQKLLKPFWLKIYVVGISRHIRIQPTDA